MLFLHKSLATGSLKDFRIARMGGKVNGECGHTNPHLEERIPSTMFINLETMSKSSSRATLEDDFEDLQDDLSPTLTSLSPQVSIPTSDPASSPSTVNQMISSPSAVSNPMISNMLMKHGALAPRRASVAVWSDDKLQQMLLSLAPQGASNSNSLTSGAAKISGRPGSSLNKAASFCSSSNNSISSLGNVLANEEVYGKLGKDGLLALMRHLDFAALFKMRLVSKSLMLLIKEYGEDSFSFSGGSKRGLFNLIDVSNRHKIINDAVLTYIAEFCGTGILHLSLKNCWSITDKGLSSLSASASCLKTIDLSSVWDSTDLGICTLAKSCPMITKIDLSNCRKLTDVSVIALLSSCPEINTIMLSYCKNLTDAIFDHIGWSNVKKLNIQRCTSIADSAFDKWPEKYLPLLQQTRQSNPAVSDNNSNNNNSVVPLHLPIVSVTSNSHEKLTSSAPATLSSDTLQIPYFSLLDLNLSDCSFLTDKTIITLCKACPELQVLSLSFCCALTEAAVENLTKSCLDLDTLDLSFCGTAVSDQSLLLIAKNLKKLSRLSIRGCVQATDVAVNQLAENAINLKVLNVSQCRNVSKTVSDSLAENGEKKIKFLLVRNQSGFGLLGSSTNQSSKNHDLASRARANTAKF